MKKYLFLIPVLALGLYLTGCGKKSDVMQESLEPVSMESLAAMNATMPIAPETKSVSPTVAAGLEPLPPSGSYKPTAQQIQTALKNAGYYDGAIDGKIGPKTKKAIEEFQKIKGLQADGKVGPKTWAVLSAYLNTAKQ